MNLKRGLQPKQRLRAVDFYSAPDGNTLAAHNSPLLLTNSSLISLAFSSVRS